MLEERLDYLTTTALTSLEKKGGFSLNRIGLEPTDGYMVTIANTESILSSLAPKWPIIYNLFEHLDTHIPDDWNKPVYPLSVFVGGWIEYDKTYLSLSDNILNLEDAIKYGIRRKQKAIWDVKEKMEIWI